MLLCTYILLTLLHWKWLLYPLHNTLMPLPIVWLIIITLLQQTFALVHYLRLPLDSTILVHKLSTTLAPFNSVTILK